jgi:hypothetical protein
MFHGFEMYTKQTVVLSVAQVAEIQDELYSILEAVRQDPVLSARVMRVVRTFEAQQDHAVPSERYRAIEEEQAQMLGLSTLMIQAQQQCQQ